MDQTDILRNVSMFWNKGKWKYYMSKVTGSISNSV